MATKKKTSKKTKAKKKAKAKRSTAAQRASFDSALASAAPRPKKERAPKAPAAFRDPRMPPPGTVLESSPILGKMIKVEVMGELDGDGNFKAGAHIKPRCVKPDGERFSTMKFRSLSAVMAEARGLNSNGWFWFGLGEFRNGELVNSRMGEDC